MNLTICIAIINFYFICALSFDCISENGTTVDWWYIYKTPDVLYSAKGDQQNYNSGLEYFYADSFNPNLYKVSYRLLNSQHSAFGRTVNQYFEHSDKQSFGYFFYNDEHVNRSLNWKWGHSKGFGFFDSDGGIFVPHSVPKFPPTLDTFQYPENAKMFAQNLFCISLELEDFEDLGKAFLYTHPYFYDALNIPESLRSKLPSLDLAFQGSVDTEEPYYNIQTSFTRLQRLPFTVFAKSSKFGMVKF